MARPLILALAVVVGVGLTGCGFEISVDETSSPRATPSFDNTLERLEVEGALRNSVDCGSETVQLFEGGTQIALTGDCPRVEIGNDSVLVTVEKVGELTVDGYGAIVLAGSIGSVELSQDALASLIQWEVGEPTIVDESESSVLRKAG